MNITKALSDQNRVRIIAALKNGELCVCQVIELLELAPSTVSKHLSILRNARLIDSRKQGRWMYYRLADENPSASVKEALAWLFRSVQDDLQIRKDNDRLEAIRKRGPECCAE
jgi:DNA-binding transcriptional ArsR family regulator